MGTKFNVRIEDDRGNAYLPHTSADVSAFDPSKTGLGAETTTVQAAIEKTEGKFGGLHFYEEAGEKYVVGADSVPKKLGNSYDYDDVLYDGEEYYGKFRVYGKHIISGTKEYLTIVSENRNTGLIVYEGPKFVESSVNNVGGGADVKKITCDIGYVEYYTYTFTKVGLSATYGRLFSVNQKTGELKLGTAITLAVADTNDTIIHSHELFESLTSRTSFLNVRNTINSDTLLYKYSYAAIHLNLKALTISVSQTTDSEGNSTYYSFGDDDHYEYRKYTGYLATWIRRKRDSDEIRFLTLYGRESPSLTANLTDNGTLPKNAIVPAISEYKRVVAKKRLKDGRYEMMDGTTKEFSFVHGVFLDT